MTTQVRKAVLSVFRSKRRNGSGSGFSDPASDPGGSGSIIIKICKFVNLRISIALIFYMAYSAVFIIINQYLILPEKN